MPFAQLLLICGFLHGFQAQFVLELSSFQYMSELEMGGKRLWHGEELRSVFT